MATKIGLKERFRTTDFLDMGHSSLERMASLYYRGRQLDQQSIQDQFRKVLEIPQTEDFQQTLLQFHAAIALAQHGDYRGVDFILDQLHNGINPKYRELAETAIRNCNQFPLAVLLGQALVFKGGKRVHPNMNTLLHISDDDLFAIADKGTDQLASFSQLNDQLESQTSVTRQVGREIAIGTIISRPVKQDRNYRYSGFVAINRGKNEGFLVVPYDLGDVLNRNDTQAHQDVFQLTRRPGRRAIVVFNTDSPYEAQQLYILPYGEQTSEELTQVLTQLSHKSEGLQVGITIEMVANRGGYRVITADGQYRWETFRAERKKIGSCVFLHELNSASLSSELSIPKDDVSDVARSFQMRSSLPKAVMVRSDSSGYTLIGPLGKFHTKQGSFTYHAVYYVETIITKDGRQKQNPFEVPELVWKPGDRAKVVSEYFAIQPASLGVVLQAYTYKEKLWARVVRPNEKEVLQVPIPELISPGSIAICEIGSKDNRTYTTILVGYRIDKGCSECFGTSRRICASCDGTGLTDCLHCGGTNELDCPELDCDSGTIPCAVCTGTGTCKHCTNGYWRNGQMCPICSGSSQCQKCKPAGSGRWGCGTCHGRGKVFCNHCKYGKTDCPECEGSHFSNCECGGKKRGHIVST